jgi:hypothetical protein
MTDVSSAFTARQPPSAQTAVAHAFSSLMNGLRLPTLAPSVQGYLTNKKLLPPGTLP